jgi:hypothetical protein
VKLPTKRVIVIESEHECIINERDFDPAVHQEVGLEVPAPDMPDEVPEDTAKAPINPSELGKRSRKRRLQK